MSPACNFLSPKVACAATISSKARGTATDCGCAAMNAFNKSILWSTGLVSVNSTSSFSSSGFAGGVTFVLRSVDDERVGRTELSEIWTGTLGEVAALGLSSVDDLGEEQLVAT